MKKTIARILFLSVFTVFNISCLPVLHNNYLEIKSKKSKFKVYEDKNIQYFVELTPEVLNRLIIKLSIQKKRDVQNLILQDFNIRLFNSSNKKELNRIFKIHVYLEHHILDDVLELANNFAFNYL